MNFFPVIYGGFLLGLIVSSVTYLVMINPKIEEYCKKINGRKKELEKKIAEYDEQRREQTASLKSFKKAYKQVLKENKTLLGMIEYLNYLLNKMEIEKAEEIPEKKTERPSELITWKGKEIYFVPCGAEDFQKKIKSNPPKGIIVFFYRNN